MARMFFISLLLLCCGVANAGNCPDFFRFVDFGQTDKNGVVYRGGSFLRAENFDGTALLDIKRTECREVIETNTDGRGYPIPVVSGVYYSPDRAALDLVELRVRSLEDSHAAAEESAATHRQRLDQSDVNIARGDTFLCAGINADQSFSCQVVSPYEGNAALVIYCTTMQCEMPVMAINQQLAVSATWDREPDANDEAIEDAGVAVVNKVAEIHNFLEPITSLNPG